MSGVNSVVSRKTPFQLLLQISGAFCASGPEMASGVTCRSPRWVPGKGLILPFSSMLCFIWEGLWKGQPHLPQTKQQAWCLLHHHLHPCQHPASPTPSPQLFSSHVTGQVFCPKTEQSITGGAAEQLLALDGKAPNG